MKIQKVKPIFPNINIARYNLAVWQKLSDGSLHFIGREVAKPGVAGEPDIGILKLFEMSKDGSITNEKVIWRPLYDGVTLEDPRVIEMPNENLVIGLTAVLRDKQGNPVPFPAIVKIDSHSSWKKELPPFLIIDTFGPGKNLTPIDGNTYLFRPEGDENNHKLLVFSLHSQNAEKIADIKFPTDLHWASWRIGTTMPPLWLNPSEALFIVHGITKRIIDGVESFIYSIGRAKLTRDNNTFTVKVAPDPILTPNDFVDSKGKQLIEELHKHRRVVYSCGGIIKKESSHKLSLYVNVGDRTTFEVEFDLNELKQGLF